MNHKDFLSKSILVVTYGRSGSTLLMGLLNQIDGYLIRGENNNFFFPIYKAYKNMEFSKEKFTGLGKKPTDAWFGTAFIDPDMVLSDMSVLAKNFILADQLENSSIRCYGFKEIRYAHKPTIDFFEDYLDFLAKIFPDCKFIFNTRNIDRVVKSEWWKDNEERSREVIAQAESAFQKYAFKHSNCFHISYEDVLSKNSKLQEMYEFIGETYDEESVDQTLSVKHSS